MTQPLALIHCALSHGRSLRGLVEALNMDIDPIYVDLPGHGDADDWDRSRDFSDQALELLLDALPREPVPVIGHSFGGVVALRAAVERPGRVSSLVLIEPPFYAAINGTYVYDRVLSDMASMHRKVENGSMASAAREFVTLWGTGENWEDIDESTRKYIVQRIELVVAGGNLLWNDGPDLLREGRLEKIDIPVTLVEGDASHQVMTRIVDALGRRIPGAEGIIVPGANHMVPVTHPVPVAEAIRDRLVWGFPDD